MDLKKNVTIVILRLLDEQLKRGMTIIVLFLPYLSYIEGSFKKWNLEINLKSNLRLVSWRLEKTKQQRA